MEIVFLCTLVGLMIIALTSGFPVAFALPGSAIATIALAAACGYFFAGDVDAYFAQDGPTEWLTAGITNFRSLYWEVERDTLIAIPLFVFMGIMLERSRIAEDLLVSMARLFGPIPGGLGISVVFVGALLAATTGILGATVIAMGLISLPAMLRNNYSKPLATGTICASGTLGQIIPPSIVLIILADQLSNAADQASTIRKANYKEITGEFSLPSELDIVSASAGDMFMGALIPGMILVGLYMLYILIVAVVKPGTAPPVPYEGKYDRKFAISVSLSLVPPLTLIFVVLGSIILGIATVNQAGAIGAVGAIIMGGYRLTEGRRGQYLPTILAVGSIVVILILLQNFNLNIKNIHTDRDRLGVILASIAVIVFTLALIWSCWRTYKIENTLVSVMVDTAKTTSMVFIILIGAAMLTSAFRAFGGEELVKEFLTGLPGGFWTQFLVVMLVIFLLGFFLDFIEIAVVVVPIVAPILMSDPSANITAVWLGVMIGLNIQTSFLTPPFGFALFYLRGVAPPEVKTTHIYKGAVAFICLQLLGLAIAGYFPPLVNYMPNRTHLTAETAPPPINPKLQQCIEQDLFAFYQSDQQSLTNSIDRATKLDLTMLPETHQTALQSGFKSAAATFGNVEAVIEVKSKLDDFLVTYSPLHTEVRVIERDAKKVEVRIEGLEKTLDREKRKSAPNDDLIGKLENQIEILSDEKASVLSAIPDSWEEQRKTYLDLAKQDKIARGQYRRGVDEAYEPIKNLRSLLSDLDSLKGADEILDGIDSLVKNASSEEAMALIKERESALSDIEGVSHIKSFLSKARRALKGDDPDIEKSLGLIADANSAYAEEVAWRETAAEALLPGLNQYDSAIYDNIGLRLQTRLPKHRATAVASCLSHHKDISMHF
ncbi:MAG: TRAP transporter large permease subunit [Acidiferrobacterales bacterium]|nr:TRAP transporter large permease subunit [Acidiferrobacterales bacterium]